MKNLSFNLVLIKNRIDVVVKNLVRKGPKGAGTTGR